MTEPLSKDQENMTDSEIIWTIIERPWSWPLRLFIWGALIAAFSAGIALGMLLG